MLGIETVNEAAGGGVEVCSLISAAHRVKYQGKKYSLEIKQFEGLRK